MSQVLLDKKHFYRHIYKERKRHSGKWNSRRKERHRNKEMYIFKNGTEDKYRVHWAKRLKRSLKKLLKHKIEMLSKRKTLPNLD